ncbi:hypothetical protein T484DRAFT_1789306 [Baffinella frigidus]|nr:hypothetical protein T484DRAFT_1789306 [Cryptophyta sp. CCMP2293]
MQGSVRGAGPVPGGGAGEKDALHGRRILVIGGTQFMGRLLVEELLRAGVAHPAP